ncbi:leucine-rich repeat domain-containing protein [Candidatus Saccharibacteria bacterium]|nr:leucine-rich repeat domain-containing protein [Candidatus Saccharibacteria bacterium]
MRITRSVSFVTRQMTNTIVRKTALVSFGFLLLTGGVIVGQNILTNPKIAQAATAPESCFAFNAGTGTITDYYNNEGNNVTNPACPRDVEIPESIGGVAVVAIGSNGFAWNKLTNVNIPSSVISIGSQAFISNNLTAITIPSGVTNIDLNAFRSNQLTSVEIPDSVTSVGNSAFENNQLTSVTFLGNITTFGVDIFRNNPLVAIAYNGSIYSPSASVPEQCYAFSAGTITKYHYLDMNTIKNSSIGCFERNVDIPSTIGGVAVTAIGVEAFQYYQLDSVTLPGSVTNIGNKAFYSNELAAITIPNSVTSIGEYAFSNNQLSSAIMSDSLTSLGRGAFSGNQLTELTIPEGLTSIGDSVFYGNQLTSITIPSSVISIADYAFYRNQINSVIIPNGVTSIGNYAFSNNQLSTVTIPSSVTSIGNSVFSSNKLTSATVTNSVASIGNGAFSGNQLTSFTIPDSVTSIGTYVLSQNHLSSVTIPDSVTSIGNGAFSGNQLTSIDIPNTVTTFGANIFNGNPLNSINYDGTTYSPLGHIPEQCFSFSTGAITNYLYADMNLIKDYGVACLSREVNIPSIIGGISVTTITGPSMYTGAFESKQLTSITIPDSVISIGNSAFSGNRFNSVDIPNGVTTIGDYAFYGNQLSTIKLPNSLTSIGRLAFYGNRLTAVDIPNSVKSLDPLSFVLQNPWGGDMDDGTNGAPDIYSYNSAEVQRAYDNIWYAQLYTEDPSNPQNLNGGSMSEYWWYSVDGNNNGSDRDTYGGHLINPAQVETKYVSSTGAQLSEPETLTGRLEDGSLLRSYLVTESAIPAPLDPYDITPEEQAVMDAGFAQYYRLDNEVTLEAPSSLSGLSLLTPGSPYSLTLAEAINKVNFVYGTALSYVDFTTPVGSSTNPTEGSVPINTIPLLAKSTFSVNDTKACKQITSASLVEPSSFYIPEGTSGQDTLGGLSFTIDCITPGGQADVSFALGGSITDLNGVKVYKQDSTNTVTDITDQVSLTNDQTPDGTRTTISYSVTDGASLDDDGTANGTIVDPIYLTAPDGTDIVLLGDGELAATGTPRWAPFTAGLVLIISGSSLTIRLLRRK